eukprot:6379789-Pyramimonas_sp.AAC.1
MDKNQVKHLDEPMAEGRVAIKTLIRGSLAVKLASAEQSVAGTLYIDIEVSATSSCANNGKDALKTLVLALRVRALV